MITQNKERRSRPALLDREEEFFYAKPLRTRRSKLRARVRADSAKELQLTDTGSRVLQVSSRVVPVWKRSFDRFWVILSLPLAIPLLLLVALWIRLVSRGPALFRQERIGMGGRHFTLYKFRSMYHGAATIDHEAHVGRLVESGSPMVKLDLLGDSRLIPGGCFLRTAGLDELPQLLNVLRGEMSLVGPRPCLPEEYGFFSASQRRRFEVLPGLTGLWQVNGKNRVTFKEMNAMDVDYAKRMSPWLDLRIMGRTPMALLRQMGECMAQHRRNRQGTSGDPMLGYGTQRLSDRS
jgi:exopolysaccharide production protein ExoY